MTLRLQQLLRKPALLAALALALAVAAGVLVALWPKEPRYEGKPMSYWLDQLAVSSTPITGFNFSFTPAFKDQETVKNAVRILGPQCLPTLLSQLQARPNWMSLNLDKAAQRLPILRPRLVSAALVSSRRRWQAVVAIQVLGDTAKPLAPDLIALATTAHDPEVREAAQAALRQLAPEEYMKLRSEAVMPVR